MRQKATYLFLMLAALLSGCNGGRSLAAYWDGVDLHVTEDNYSAVQDLFAGFAERLVTAPEKEASEALNGMIDRIQDDEVDYIIYSQWMEYAFHNYFSPCRNYGLFNAAVNRFAADGILSSEDVERLQKMAGQDSLNRPGGPCTLPAGLEPKGSTLYLVLNLDCRTCLQSLEALAGSHPEADHLALCFGYNPLPSIKGWKYLKPEGMKDFFDLDAAPFWFLTADDGTVLQPYSAIFPDTDKI